MEPQHGNGRQDAGKSVYYQPRVVAFTATRQGIPAPLVWGVTLAAALYAMIGMMAS